MIITFIQNAIRFSTVFLFGSTGETITEKSGNLNLGIPGIMCVGALGGCIGEAVYLKNITDPSQIVGFWAVLVPILFALLFAGFMGLFYCFLTVSLKCNQNVTGLTITTFGAGITNFFGAKINRNFFNYAANSFTASIAGGKLGWFGDLFLSYGVLVYLAIIIALLTAVFMKKTRTGLSLRSVGENPATADAVGISVTKYKYLSTIIGSGIAGLGGLFYIMDYLKGSWEYSIDAMGWLAIALVIFTIWKTDWGILGSMVFGALYIAPSYINVNFAQKELVKMIPFLVTMAVLIFTSAMNRKESQPPDSLGMTYFREDR